MTDKRQKRTWGDRGAAAVEMAFMTMFLFILVAGIVDLGRALFTYIGVQDAAQEGALYGSYDYDAGEIVARAIAATDYPALQAGDIATNCDSSSDPHTVTVTVTHSVDLIMPIVSQWYGGSIDLSRTFTGTVFLGCP